MKNKIIISIGFFIAVVLSTILFWTFTIKNTIKSTETMRITLKGAIELQESKIVNVGTKTIEIIRNSHPLEGIDWSKIDQKEKLYRDSEIFVPFIEGYKSKYRVSDGLTDQQINSLLVNSTIKKEIKKLIKQNPNPTWDDFDNIPGVGEKTLNILKTQLEL